MIKRLKKVLVSGSIGLDTIETPFGAKKDILGGSATYASLAVGYFCQPILLATCGTDLTQKQLELFERHNIATRHILQDGKTFRWHGKYDEYGHVQTLSTQFEGRTSKFPEIPKSPPKFVLLANLDPEIQLKILEKLPRNTFTLVDTIEFWIKTKRENVKQIFSQASAISITDTEAKLLAGTPNTILAGKFILSLNPRSKFAVIKKGEHGALTFLRSGAIFSSPGYPLEIVKDPTGAGDSLAGGLTGYLASRNKIDEATIRKGVVYGSIISSFVAENMGASYRDETTREAIEERFRFVKSIGIF